MGELNPNHPVTAALHDSHHKIVGMLMQHYGITEFEVTSAKIERLEGMAVLLDARGGRLRVRLISMEEGERIARREGGLPV